MGIRCAGLRRHYSGSAIPDGTNVRWVCYGLRRVPKQVDQPPAGRMLLAEHQNGERDRNAGAEHFDRLAGRRSREIRDP